MFTSFGSCHCKDIQFEINLIKKPQIHECNCSICSKKGFLHIIVPSSRLKKLTGEDKLETYTFNTHTAKHFFCKKCGICPYYIPRSNPDGYSVNFRCLDGLELEDFEVIKFNGKDHENQPSLANLSQE